MGIITRILIMTTFTITHQHRRYITNEKLIADLNKYLPMHENQEQTALSCLRMHDEWILGPLHQSRKGYYTISKSYEFVVHMVNEDENKKLLFTAAVSSDPYIILQCLKNIHSLLRHDAKKFYKQFINNFDPKSSTILLGTL
jgi:hypothetical protein